MSFTLQLHAQTSPCAKIKGTALQNTSEMFSLLPAVSKFKALGNFVTDFLGLLLLIRSVFTRAFNTGNIYLNTREKRILYGIEIGAHLQSGPKLLGLLGQ